MVPTGSPGHTLTHTDLDYHLVLLRALCLHTPRGQCKHTEPLSGHRTGFSALTGKSTLTSEPSSSRTRQVMVVLAVPAAGM